MAEPSGASLRGALLPASLGAVLSVVLQSIAYATGLLQLYALLSPVHTLCCLALLTFLSFLTL